jgi:hypothetical protein
LAVRGADAEIADPTACGVPRLGRWAGASGGGGAAGQVQRDVAVLGTESDRQEERPLPLALAARAAGVPDRRGAVTAAGREQGQEGAGSHPLHPPASDDDTAGIAPASGGHEDDPLEPLVELVGLG